jgi:branched-chain amino acid aminotransferase
VQNGDAVWEGLRVYDGKIFRLNEHLDRLQHSAKALAYEGIPSHEELIEQIKRTLAANDMRDGVHIRLKLTRGLKYTSGLDPRINQVGPTLIILAEHKPPVYDKTGIRLITSTYRRPNADVLDQKIHSSNQLTSILAKIQANASGADDALMLDQRGFVAETNATHVYIVDKDRVLTPTTAACPEGITRSVVIELCEQNDIECEVGDFTLAEIYRANEMFCSGTMGELASVVEVDGRQIADGGTGPVTKRLSELFRALTEKEGVVVV